MGKETKRKQVREATIVEPYLLPPSCNPSFFTYDFFLDSYASYFLSWPRLKKTQRPQDNLYAF